MQGKGQHVDMALLDCSVGLLASQALHYLVTGTNPPRMGNAHAQVSAYGVFPAADSPIILSPANDGLFCKLLNMLGRDDLLGDARFASNEARLANRPALDTLIAAETARYPREWLPEQCPA